MDNYTYCVEFARATARDVGSKFAVLDYGCGAGQVVLGLRKHGVRAFGCDVFYAAGDYSRDVPSDALGRVILRMTDGRIPFADASFDLVVSNQVMEHVAELDAALAELARVLKPGGRLLCLFPDRGVWREGHTGIPFLHWFPRGSALRRHYATALRACGLGTFTAGKGRREWARASCEYLDRWTHYRSYAEIRRAFARHFDRFTHVEPEWLDRRLESSPLRLVSRAMPARAKRLLAHKLAGMVVVCAKAPTEGSSHVGPRMAANWSA